MHPLLLIERRRGKRTITAPLGWMCPRCGLPSMSIILDTDYEVYPLAPRFGERCLSCEECRWMGEFLRPE